MNVLKFLIPAVVLIEIISVAWYITKGGLSRKTFCASLFVLIGVLLTIASGGFTLYSVLIVVGAAFGAFGDFALDVKSKEAWFFIGLGSFLIGHIFYVVAFICKLTQVADNLTPSRIFMMIALIFAFSSMFVVAGIRLKVAPGNALVPVLFYIVTICTMFVFAVALSIALAKTGNSRLIPAVICLSLGSASFVFSDSLLSLKMFSNVSIKKGGAKILISYFGAQLLLAFSIYFIQTVAI